MLMYTVSLDSGTPEQVAAVRAEAEQSLGYENDTLSLLIAIEEQHPDHIRGRAKLTNDIEPGET